MRGKHGQKHYTAFLAEVPEHVRDKYEPQLSEEHSDWHWFKVCVPQSVQGAFLLASDHLAAFVFSYIWMWKQSSIVNGSKSHPLCIDTEDVGCSFAQSPCRRNLVKPTFPFTWRKNGLMYEVCNVYCASWTYISLQLDGLVELHNYQAKNGIPNEEESPQGEADDDNKHHFPKHLDDREDGKTYIKDRVKLHPWVRKPSTQALSPYGLYFRQPASLLPLLAGASPPLELVQRLCQCRA